MAIKLSSELSRRYPNLKLEPEDDGRIISRCKKNRGRCLNPVDIEDDYSFSPADDKTIIRVLTAKARGCDLCQP